MAGASVIAIHLPSGTTYETTSRADGRFMIINMRVGGPYSVTVAFTGTGTAAFAPETQSRTSRSTSASPPTSTFNVKHDRRHRNGDGDGAVRHGVQLGAAPARRPSVNRETLATLPTVRGRISDFTRLTPQTSGTNSFGGQDNRMNNMTVNGAAFNNSFGLGGQPGERTGVAPISLEAIEQVQVSIAPFDVRQGNFVGASVDTVTRSGTNSLRALGLSPLPQRRLRRHRGARPGGQPRHVQHQEHRRLGRRARSSRTACSCSATSRTKRTRVRSTPSAPTTAASRSAATSRACSRRT